MKPEKHSKKIGKRRGNRDGKINSGKRCRFLRKTRRQHHLQDNTRALRDEKV